MTFFLHILEDSATYTRIIGQKTFGIITTAPQSVLSVFSANANICNSTFPGSRLVELPDNGNPKIQTQGGSEPYWHTGFDTINDLLDYYADQNLTITLGTNVQ